MKHIKSMLIVSCLAVLGLTGCPVEEQQSQSAPTTQPTSTQTAAVPDKQVEPVAVEDALDVSMMTLEEMILAIRDDGHRSILAMFEFSENDRQKTDDGWTSYTFVWQTFPFPVQFKYNEQIDRYSFFFPADYLAKQRRSTVSELIAEYDELVEKYGCDSGDEDGALTRNLNMEGINIFLQQLGLNNEHHETEEDFPTNMYISSPKEDW